MMKKVILILLSLFFCIQLVEGQDRICLWGQTYQKKLMHQVSKKLPELTSYPHFEYPNKGYESLPKYYPHQKVLLFGYGSLINKQSAQRTLKPESIETMQPAIAFGAKRIFNYQAKKTDHWGGDRIPKKKLCLI